MSSLSMIATLAPSHTWSLLLVYLAAMLILGRAEKQLDLVQEFTSIAKEGFAWAALAIRNKYKDGI